jgi:hypothetical protein
VNVVAAAYESSYRSVLAGHAELRAVV